MKEQLLNGAYRHSEVRAMGIHKPNGEVRVLETQCLKITVTEQTQKGLFLGR